MRIEESNHAQICGSELLRAADGKQPDRKHIDLKANVRRGECQSLAAQALGVATPRSWRAAGPGHKGPNYAQRQPPPPSNKDRCRNLGDPFSMFDSSTHTTIYPKFYDTKALTHQYQNNGHNFKTD